ncbi:MAG: hypothetical protein ACI8XM_000837 [Haloarculaceae archaeon]|jgi:hypothetical protein
MSTDDTSKANQSTISEDIPPDVDLGDAESTGTEQLEVGQEPPEELPIDQVFEVVKNERRRLAIDFIGDSDGEVNLGELAEHIAAIENDKEVKAISSKERKRVYVGLYQCHLPKMDDMDIIEFNQDRGQVTLGPNADQLDPYIETDDDRTVTWSMVYLLLAVAGGLLLATSLLGGAALGLTPSVVTGLVVVSLGTASMFQLWTERRTE